MSADYAESERELAAYHTSSLGVSAQGYDDSGGRAFDSDTAVARLCVDQRHRASVREHEAVERTLRDAGAHVASVVKRRYHPTRLGNGAFQNAVGPLAVLCVDTPSVARDFAHWRAEHPTRSGGVVQWLDDSASQGGASRRHATYMIEAATSLHVALGHYDTCRLRRIRDAAAAKAQARSERDAHYARVMGERPKIRAPRTRLAVIDVASMIAAILAEHADLLSLADAAE